MEANNFNNEGAGGHKFFHFVSIKKLIKLLYYQETKNIKISAVFQQVRCNFSSSLLLKLSNLPK